MSAPPNERPPNPDDPPQYITEPITLTGETDVAIEGTDIVYEPGFSSWCTHHFTVLDPAPGSVLVRANSVKGATPRVVVKTLSDHLKGCRVQIVVRHPPEIVGKDANGNTLIREVPDEPTSGHISWTTVGL